MSEREFGMVFEIEVHQVLLSMASTFYQKASLKQGIQEERTIGMGSPVDRLEGSKRKLLFCGKNKDRCANAFECIGRVQFTNSGKEELNSKPPPG